MSQPLRVLITGAAGQIAYSLIPIIARGDVFGHEQPLILHLLDIPFMEKALNGRTNSFKLKLSISKLISASNSHQTSVH